MYRERQKQTEGEACHLKKWHRQKKYYIKFKDMDSEEAKKKKKKKKKKGTKDTCPKLLSKTY